MDNTSLITVGSANTDITILGKDVYFTPVQLFNAISTVVPYTNVIGEEMTLKSVYVTEVTCTNEDGTTEIKPSITLIGDEFNVVSVGYSLLNELKKLAGLGILNGDFAPFRIKLLQQGSGEKHYCKLKIIE
jgi:D-ribose pyranose/furanose isomerase RbsD